MAGLVAVIFFALYDLGLEQINFLGWGLVALTLAFMLPSPFGFWAFTWPNRQ